MKRKKTSSFDRKRLFRTRAQEVVKVHNDLEQMSLRRQANLRITLSSNNNYVKKKDLASQQKNVFTLRTTQS